MRLLLAAVLVIGSPGIEAGRAFASNVAGRGAGAVPSVQLPTIGAPSVGLPKVGANGLIPALPGAAIPAIPSLPGSAVSGSVPVSGPNVSLPGGPGPAAPVVAPTAHEILRAGVERLQAAEEPGRRGVLDQIFTGAAGLSSGDQGGVPAGGFAAQPGLPAQLPLPQLKALAIDANAPDADRRAAVKAIANRSDDPARLALEEIGAQAGPSAADYEIKRLALRELAGQGKLVSLPAVSEEHGLEILAKLAADKPEALAIDYDDTLEDSRAPQASAETGRLLKGVADAGVETMVLTGRSDKAIRRVGTIFESLSTLSPAQRAAISVGSDSGARVHLFDAQGEKRLIFEEPQWTPGELSGMKTAVSDVGARFGLDPAQPDVVNEYRFTFYLSKTLTVEQAKQARDYFRERLAELGVKADVRGWKTHITVQKVSKALGVSLLREHRDAFRRLRDVYRLVPRFMQAAAQKLALKISSKPVAPEKTLLVGDLFFGGGAIDSPMVAGAPGALAISVGGAADPRQDHTFVWHTKGPAGTRQILEVLAKPADESLDRKGVFGLFLQRSLSIAVYIPTIVAYPSIAIAAVGVPAFGALMAFGTLAAIAMGPVNGIIAKKLSSRNAMLFNVGVRSVLALALPAFWALGVLNFWTLLIAAIANGWLLSSTITTEGIFVRRMAGKQFPTINALTWMNFLGLQVLMGLLIGFRPYLETFQSLAARVGLDMSGQTDGLMIPFVVSAAVHALLVAPVIWLMIPNIKSDGVAAPASAKARSSVAARERLIQAMRQPLGFIGKYWKEALLLGAGIGAYFALSSTLPAALALIYWISRTGGFKKLWANANARFSLIYSALAGGVFFPLQTMVLPLLAKAAAGDAGKEQLLSQLLGALFFGQLIANSGQAKLPNGRIPLIGRLDSNLMLKGAVVALAGVWSLMTLFPGSWLAAGLVAATAALLIKLSARLTERGWVQYFGVGLLGMALPLLFPGQAIAMFVGALLVGLGYGPTYVTLLNYFYKNVPKEETEEYVGVQGSLFNAAITLGFGVATLLAAMFQPAFPGLLVSLVVLYAVIGAAFFFAPRRLPGLPADAVKSKSEA